MTFSYGDRATLLGFRVFSRVPEWFSRALMAVAADGAWLVHGEGVRQLEANLRRARPRASRRELRRLSREGMRTYLRYYAEAFALPRLTPDQLEARVRTVNADATIEASAAGRTVVLALAHQGNYDLAGAWATTHLAPVTTVAERLRPPEVFDEFVRLRATAGLNVLPLDRGADVFRQLVRVAQLGNAAIPLIADRDLSHKGIEVQLLGERARVAPGPAALAVATGAVLVAAHLRHERLHGARRRAAGSPWGVVVTFSPVVSTPAGVSRQEQVRQMTQTWVDTLSADIAAHPTHWHMLQKVFVADEGPAGSAVTGSPVEETA